MMALGVLVTLRLALPRPWNCALPLTTCGAVGLAHAVANPKQPLTATAIGRSSHRLLLKRPPLGALRQATAPTLLLAYMLRAPGGTPYTNRRRLFVDQGSVLADGRRQGHRGAHQGFRHRGAETPRHALGDVLARREVDDILGLDHFARDVVD